MTNTITGDCGCPKIMAPLNNGKYHGAFAPNDKGWPTVESIKEFEKVTGQKLAIALTFLAFYELFLPKEIASLMAEKSGALFIKVEPWSRKDKEDASFSLKDIIDGKHDQKIREFAEQCKDFKRPILVSFGHEMNAGWYPWGDKPEEYIKAYQHFFKILEEVGACNVTRVWNPNVSSKDNFVPYYPGDEWVDWIALDGYTSKDWTPSPLNFKQIFEESLSSISRFNKPILIGETAIDPKNDPEGLRQKSCFIYDLIRSVAKNEQISGFVYFNINKFEDGKYKRWALDSQATKESYRHALSIYNNNFSSYLLIKNTCPIQQNKGGEK